MRFSLLGLLLILCFPSPLSGQILINEFMASNAATIEDPDFGESADWIEIYNASPTTIDLRGYFLTDNFEDTTKWAIPNGTFILGKSYLLIWADKEDIGLHCNFKLSNNGEELALYSPLGMLLDSITFHAQNTDISYGRSTDGAPDFGFFSNPSPNYSNSGTSYNGVSFYKPEFSKEGGAYTSPITVEISSNGGVPRYTLDGSEPTINSTAYNTPISISGTTVLRARVFEAGMLPGKTITHSYFFDEGFEHRKLPIVSLVTDEAYFFDSLTGIYAQDFKPLWEYPINVEFFENEGNNRAAFNEAAGIKMNGNNSWRFPQKILGVYFRNEYGEKTVDFPIFPEQKRDKFDYFVLRASGNDQGSTFFKDGLCQALMRDNMDFELQGFRPAAVYVNGEYFGLHNMRSKQNEEYFEYHFGLERGEYDLLVNDGEIDEGDNVAYTELQALINLDLAIESNFQAVAEILDIDNTLDYLIAEMWTGNRSFGHNVKLWRPRTPDAKWRWVPRDMDRSFADYDKHGYVYFTGMNVAPFESEYIRTVFRQLLKNQGFKSMFISKFADHLHTTFHPSRVAEFAEKMKANISNEIPYHLQKWGGLTASYGDALPNEAHWHNEIGDLTTFAIERQAFIYKELNTYLATPPKSSLATFAEGGKIRLNGLEIPAEQWTAPYFQSIPIELKAEPKIGQKFDGWSVGSFETLIPKSSFWKYLDNGIDPGVNWQNEGYDDSAWGFGIGQFGYGEGDELTQLNFGPDSSNKFITAYFRQTFQISDITEYSGQLVLNLLKDDGAVIYLNGIEIHRQIMPQGIITANTVAYHTADIELENEYTQITINTQLLKQGQNTIAVEVHQRDPESSDMGFDMQVQGVKKGTGGVFSTEEILTFSLSDDNVLVANFSSTGACTLASTIDQNTTLTKACSPYLAIDDVRVLAGVSLIVEGGVEIQMPTGKDLRIEGDLQVLGTANEPVRIRQNSNSTSWGNLAFLHTSQPSNLHYLILENATQGKHPLREKAALSAFHADVTMNHISFENAPYSLIFTQYSDVKLDSSTLQSDVSGSMIHYQYGTGHIKNCDIRGSKKNSTSIHFDGVLAGRIEANKIHDFLDLESDAIEINEASLSITIDGNFIHNIGDKGIYMSGKSRALISNNTIINCEEGVALKKESIATLNQNTFYNNEKAVRCYENGLGEGGGTAQVLNCILSNSSKSALDIDNKSTASVNYTLSDTDTLPGSTNLFGNPEFLNPNLNDFHFRSTSPCINAGSWGGNNVDLGTALHRYSAPGTVLISAIHYHPTDSIDAEFIELQNPTGQVIDLSGFSLGNAVDFVFPQGSSIAPLEVVAVVKNPVFYTGNSMQIFTWDDGKLDNSGEKIELKNATGIIVDFVEYDDMAPWATEADGQGAYLSLIGDDLDNHFAENWESIQLTTRIDKSKQHDNEVVIYPNPVQNNLFIRSLGIAIQKLEVYDVIGNKVIEKVNIHNKFNLNIEISTLPCGLYFLKINGQTSHRFYKRS